MYKKHIITKDYEGNKVEKDLYFNFTKAEVLEMQVSAEGGLDKRLQMMSSSGDTGYIVTTIKDMILKSYGKMTEDGFVKTKEIAAAFATTEAYSDFFMELVSNPKEQEAFFIGVMPKEVSATIKEQFKNLEKPAVIESTKTE